MPIPNTKSATVPFLIVTPLTPVATMPALFYWDGL
jgi:hypothetical protein